MRPAGRETLTTLTDDEAGSSIAASNAAAAAARALEPGAEASIEDAVALADTGQLEFEIEFVHVQVCVVCMAEALHCCCTNVLYVALQCLSKFATTREPDAVRWQGQHHRVLITTRGVGDVATLQASLASYDAAGSAIVCNFRAVCVGEA